MTPLDQKGDAVKAELCGAVFASHLKKYFEQHAQIKISQWYHLLDSQTILGAIQRESSGFRTFFTNKIGEIQSSTWLQDWWGIPGQLNIADIITQGAGPKELDVNSEWQEGPKFLHFPECEWPIMFAKEVSTAARESINNMQKKSFAAALTRAQAKKDQSSGRRPPAGAAVKNLVDERRFSVA